MTELEPIRVQVPAELAGLRLDRALAALLPDFRYVEEHSLCEGMAAFMPVYKLLGKIPAVSNISNRIVVLEKE